MVITKVEAQAALNDDDRERIKDWVMGGVADYFSDLYHADARLIHRKSTRASCIHDHIITRVAQGFQDVHGARMTSRRGLHLLSIRDVMVCRFKKLDRNRRPRNIQTQQTLDFMGQMPIFGAATATNVIVGYELNATARQCQAVSIVCPGEDANEWEWELLDTALLTITPPPQQQPGTPDVKIAKAKLKKDSKLEVVRDDAQGG